MTPVLDEPLDRRRAWHWCVRLHERIAKRLQPLLVLLHRQFLDDDPLRRTQRRWNLVEHFVDHVKILVAKHFAHWRGTPPIANPSTCSTVSADIWSRVWYIPVSPPRAAVRS